MSSSVKAIIQIEELQKQLENSRKNFLEKEAQLKNEFKEKLSSLKHQQKENEKKLLDKISKLEQNTTKANAEVVAKLISALGSENFSQGTASELMQFFSGDSLVYLEKLIEVSKDENKNNKKLNKKGGSNVVKDNSEESEEL